MRWKSAAADWAFFVVLPSKTREIPAAPPRKAPYQNRGQKLTGINQMNSLTLIPGATKEPGLMAGVATHLQIPASRSTFIR
jgi:hypothetical protein